MGVWETWSKDAEIRELEHELKLRNIHIQKSNDFVRFANTSMYTVREFKKGSEDFIRLYDKAHGRPASSSIGKPKIVEGIPRPPEFTADDTAVRSNVSLFRAMSDMLLAERDAWRSYAVALEGHIANLPQANDTKKFAAAKRLMAQHLHPDAASNDLERLIRDQLFKTLWTKLEEIEKR